MVSESSDYRFQRFTWRHLLSDMRFSRGAPSFGDELPDAELHLLDGGTTTVGELASDRPALFITGSITCPMTASSTPTLKAIYDDYGDRVNFVTINVREAHPGQSRPQPQTIEEKKDHAIALSEHYNLPWQVVVDDIDGSLHRFMDSNPNSVFLVDTDRIILFRAHWASDGGALRAALAEVAIGNEPVKKHSRAMLLPVARAMGHLRPTLQLAGPGAERDLLLAASPMALAGRLASVFRPLTLDQRGVVTSLAMVVFITFELAFLLLTVKRIVM